MTHATSHEQRLQATSFFYLPQRGRWPQAGGGLFVRKWDVGCGRWGVENSIESDFHGPLATGHQPLFKPPPRPSPKGRGTLPDANSKPRMLRWLQTTSHDYKPHATGHRPLLRRSGRRGLRPSWMSPVTLVTKQRPNPDHRLGPEPQLSPGRREVITRGDGCQRKQRGWTAHLSDAGAPGVGASVTQYSESHAVRSDAGTLGYLILAVKRRGTSAYGPRVR